MLFSVNASVSYVSGRKNCPMVFVQETSSWYELRRTSGRWDRLISARMGVKTVEQNLPIDIPRWHLRRDGMRWDEKSSHNLRWDEAGTAKCKCEVWSAGCEACTVKCDESVCLALDCAGAARRSCSWTATLQQVRTKHARRGLAGAQGMQVL